MSREAIAALERAIEAIPDDVELRIHLAQLQLQEGQRDAAIATLAQRLGDRLPL